MGDTNRPRLLSVFEPILTMAPRQRRGFLFSTAALGLLLASGIGALNSATMRRPFWPETFLGGIALVVAALRVRSKEGGEKLKHDEAGAGA